MKEIAKYITKLKERDYSFKDFEKINQLFTEEKYVQGLEIELEQDWNNMDNAKPDAEPSLHHVLDNIHDKLQLNKRKKGNVKVLVKAYLKVASVLLILVLGYSVWKTTIYEKGQLSDSWIKIQSPAGERTQFILPDGSECWLNGNTSLEYLENFTASRKLKLTGEAFFDVKGDEDHPFQVEVKELMVEVLGTEFNVSAYENDSEISVVLASGAVRLTGLEKRFEMLMSPNEKLTFSKNKGTVSLQKCEAKKYIAWKEGRLFFNNVEMENVLLKLEHFYNVRYKLLDPEIAHLLIRAKFNNSTIEEVNRFLTLSLQVQVNEKHNENETRRIFEIVKE